jgi:hypothetical protein
LKHKNDKSNSEFFDSSDVRLYKELAIPPILR